MLFTSKVIAAIIFLVLILAPSLSFAQYSSASVQTNAHVKNEADNDANAFYGYRDASNQYDADPDKAMRILEEVGTTFLIDTGIVALGITLLLPVAFGSGFACGGYDGDSQDACQSEALSTPYVKGVLIGTSLLLAVGPAFAIHEVHHRRGSQGDIGWAYGGAAIGTAVGLGLGALTFLSKNHDSSYGLMFLGSLLGSTIGAILGYELSASANIKKAKQASINNLHPIIELSEERNIFGFGFDF